MSGVLLDVFAERQRQDAKWGEQNHPDGTGAAERILRHTAINLDLRTGDELATILRNKCELEALRDRVTWRDIFLEEVFEAMAEDDTKKLRGELIQAAAVAVSWVEAIDRREAAA